MQLERYRIESEIGRGAMATVYRAYDTQAGRYVALKLLHRKFVNDEAIRTRFIQEARTIAQLNHRAIIRVLHAAQVGEDIFLVMPLLEGGSLASRLRHGPLSVVETINVLERITAALDYAHERGVIHRDVKPDNILYDESGQVYLGDFGIIRLAESNLTMTGSGLIGTPAYMSPEQIQGRRDLDGRTDLYALGVVLFEMLTGRTPYEGDSSMAIAMQHVNAPVPDIKQYMSSLPSGWRKIINRAMAKKPGNRFQTGAEMMAAVNAVTDGPRSERRKIGITTFFIGLGGLALALVFLRPPRESEEIRTPTVSTGVTEIAATAALVLVPTGIPTVDGGGGPATATSFPPTATATVAPSMTPSPGAPVVRAITNVFTRVGPGLEYPILGALSRGEQVPVIARDRSGFWYLVRLANQQVVWISIEYVTEPPGGAAAVAVAATIPAAPTPTPSLTPTPVPTRTIPPPTPVPPTPVPPPTTYPYPYP